MADTPDMILPMLREMRAENMAEHEKTRSRFVMVENRLDKLEATLNSFRQALTADSLLSKLVTGEFAGPIETPERRMRQLERSK